MNIHEQIVASAKRTLAIERDAIDNLTQFIDEDFAKAVALILNSKGRVILTGIGKSAIIAQKISATLNSTGTPAIFMHAADAIHGDLGTVQKDDIVLCLSKSGGTPEIKVLANLVKNMGNAIIAMTANRESPLARQANHILFAYSEKEACPYDLAPTSSTTVQLVMGDALAMALLDQRGFTQKDFAKYHPGGTLGKKLYLRVCDLTMLHEKPAVGPKTPIKAVIVEISQKRLGVTAVLNGKKLVGIVTDGDIRRMLEDNDVLTGLTAEDIMSQNPKTINENALAMTAMDVLEKHSISQLISINDDGDYTGVIHLHDLIKEGII